METKEGDASNCMEPLRRALYCISRPEVGVDGRREEGKFSGKLLSNVKPQEIITPPPFSKAYFFSFLHIPAEDKCHLIGY
jgi:hypothetical protein